MCAYERWLAAGVYTVLVSSDALLVGVGAYAVGSRVVVIIPLLLLAAVAEGDCGACLSAEQHIR